MPIPSTAIQACHDSIARPDRSASPLPPCTTSSCTLPPRLTEGDTGLAAGLEAGKGKRASPLRDRDPRGDFTPFRDRKARVATACAHRRMRCSTNRAPSLPPSLSSSSFLSLSPASHRARAHREIQQHGAPRSRSPREACALRTQGAAPRSAPAPPRAPLSPCAVVPMRRCPRCAVVPMRRCPRCACSCSRACFRGKRTQVALITGITGQDGSYLTELLIEKGYTVHGIIRRSSSFNTGRIEHLYKDRHEDGALISRFRAHVRWRRERACVLKHVVAVDPLPFPPSLPPSLSPSLPLALPPSLPASLPPSLSPVSPLARPFALQGAPRWCCTTAT